MTVVSPDDGSWHQLAMPDPLPTNICFGGPGLNTAYVTLSGTGRIASLPWPAAGLPLAFT